MVINLILALCLTFHRFRGFAIQSLFAETAEIFVSQTFFIFQGTTYLCQKIDFEYLRWNATRNSQSLWVLASHDPIFYFPNKIVSWFNLLLILQMQDRVQFWEMVIQLFIWYVLVIRSFLNFPLIPRICSAEQIGGIGRYFSPQRFCDGLGGGTRT